MTAQTSSSIFETGDEFTFVGTSDNFFDENRSFEVLNTSDNSQAFRLEYNNFQSSELMDTYNDITTVRDVTSPFGTFPTVVLSDRQADVTDGYRTGDSSKFDAGRPVGDQWNNDTYTEDPTGHSYYEEDTQPIFGNSTYAVIFPEMIDNQIPAQWFIPIPQEYSDLTYPEMPNATLDSRSVSSGSGSYQINGASHEIGYTNISSSFFYSFYDDFNLTLPFGPEDDPDTEWVTLNASIQVYQQYYFEYIFDTNGMLIEMVQSMNNDIWMSATGNNVTLTTPEGGQINIDVYLDNNFVSNWYDESQLDQISMLYGNTRPASSGENRLEAGQTLIYDISGRNDFTYDNGSENFAFGGDLEGLVTIDVFRHQPGFFEAVFQLEAYFSSDGTMSFDDHDQHPEGMIFDLDVIESPSNDSYEIYPFIDENMHFEIPEFLHNPDNGLGLDNHDGGIGDTSITLVDVTEDNEFFDENINGFDYIMDVHVIEGEYSRTDTFTVYSEFFQSDAEVTIDALGFTYMAYDEATGVMIERGEELTVDITITPIVPANLDQTTQSINIDIDQRFFITLSTHPNFYLEEQTELPEGYTSEVTSDTTTTSNSTEDGTENPDLELPFMDSVAPILGIMIMTTLVLRKRRM